MEQPCWVVLQANPHADYTIDVVFADGKQGIFDFAPLLDDRYYSSLENQALFMTARIECGTVVWDNDMDIAPEFLYENCRQ